ncbi:MAG: glucuronate isomerase [Ignavibacteriales bacterium]|nr:glucuronate isomerase [Ignavibacteriales bacterium]
MKKPQPRLSLKADRFFDPNPAVRTVARKLYQSVKNLPIISPHGHVDANLFVENNPFPNPAELFLIPDHYIYRMLYSQGIPMESLGVRPLDGSSTESNARKIWKLFGENYYLFRGTPTGAWLNHEFAEVFGIRKRFTGATAIEIYDEINEKLQQPKFRPRALFDRFKIAVLSTTDAATDTLEPHKKIRASGWKGNIIPCFRPDGVTDLKAKNWKTNIELLTERAGVDVTSYSRFIQALENRRVFFKSMGAVSTDHGVSSPHTHEFTKGEGERIFQRALMGQATAEDAAQFTAHMLMEMARMSIEDGLVMQIHPGSDRNHNRIIYDKYGPDKGCDIPMPTEYTHNLKDLLNKYGNDSRLTVIVFTLDETTYARELAPLAGHYPAMKLGPPWWFHDSIEGMMRFRSMVTETAGIYNTAGFNDDTRAFVSIPARHDLSRRVDANFLAGLVTRHIVELDEAQDMIYDLANGLVKKAYKL